MASDQGRYGENTAAENPENREEESIESWVCPNDETINTGDTCIICGCSRPAGGQRAEQKNTDRTESTDRTEQENTNRTEKPAGTPEMKKYLIVAALVVFVLIVAIIYHRPNSEPNSEPNRETESTRGCQHTWSAWQVSTEATCLKAGTLTRTCGSCASTEQTEIPRLTTHKWGPWQPMDNRHRRTCPVCGKSEFTVLFGRYEQDGNWNNGPDDIEWIVLEQEGQYQLLMSMHILDLQPFAYWGNMTWENSSIREWLNGTFYNQAFSVEEKNKIVLADSMTSGIFPKDRVFLLSVSEVNHYGYFQSDPTAIVRKKLSYADQATENWWWLSRTSSTATPTVAIVYLDGSVTWQPWQNARDGGVRPVIVCKNAD